MGTQKKKLIITLDGPAGSGKSTTARELAARLGYTYLDTGAMYRAITLYVLERSIDPNDWAAVTAVLPGIALQLTYESGFQKTWLNGRDVSSAIRSPEVTKNVSAVSSVPEVRRFCRTEQQRIGRSGGYVVDGRDIGSVVFPEADVKFYMTANVNERARRRLKEMNGKTDMDLDAMIQDIERRDHIDTHRSESPLIKPADAIEIDTSELDIATQVDRMMGHIRKKFPS